MTASSMTEPGDGRIPVSVLTGFLGSGKTTLLNRLTRHPDMDGTVLLINEFGDVGIDHHLVEYVNESILLLDSGCLCCTMQGDFLQALRSLHDRLARREIARIRRVIVETTGLADPVPVLYSLMEDRYVAARYFCDGVLTMVDGSRSPRHLADHPEAVRQVAMADRIIISKGDIAGRDNGERIGAWLNAINPTAPRLFVTQGEITPSQLFAGGVYAPSGRASEIAKWLELDGDAHDHRHGADPDKAVLSFTVRFPQPVPWRGLSVTMGGILGDYGAKLLRAKGVLAVAGASTPMVIQCVQDVAYPAIRLARWPADGPLADRHGRLVFIAQGLAQAEVADIRARLLTLPDDAAAMRTLATTPLLPTRCWLAQRLPWMGGGSFETPGWVVQPPIRRRRS